MKYYTVVKINEMNSGTLSNVMLGKLGNLWKSTYIQYDSIYTMFKNIENLTIFYLYEEEGGI